MKLQSEGGTFEVIPQRYTKMLWGTIVGTLLGRMFGQLNVVWAWLVETELRRYMYPDGRTYFSHEPPLTVRVLSNPNGALNFGMLLGAALGFLIAFTLTYQHKMCPACKRENPRLAKVCQFCGRGFDPAESKKECPSCGDEYINGAQFCPICAIELKTPTELQSQATAVSDEPSLAKKCPDCGSANMLQRTACHKCGKPM